MCWWDFSSYLLYRKKASCFIVKGVLELGLPSSSLPLSGFLTFPVSLSFFLSLLQALPPPLFFLSLRLKRMFAAYGVLIVYYQSGSHVDNYM